MALVDKHSFCRICMGHCGMVVTVDDETERLVAIRADREDSQTLGFACFKGLQAVEAHQAPDRILHPLKRQADGSFQRIGLEQALDEIAAKMADIRARHGGEAFAGYKGGGGYFTGSAVLMLRDWLKAVGSEKVFSSSTIDQSAKVVSLGRIGLWPAGRVPFAEADLVLLIGGNPLVSLTGNVFDLRNPMKRLKEAKARGMKLVIIDPRRSETARFADFLLQPLPGEDPTVVAGLLHVILAEGWEDKAFCEQHVEGMDALRAAVAPFTPDYVARRADVPADALRRVAELFARSKKGIAGSVTGPDMSPRSNLAEHLIELLNVVCGRFLRAGERIPNPGVIAKRRPARAQVVPAPRWWEHGYKSRIGGFGMIAGELPTGIMADEILEPGDGQVRCFINHGGNPASAVPDQRRIVKALRSLELLVSIEPYMSNTARLSHYILPPKMQYERPDMPLWIYENLLYPEPFMRYTPAVAAPPAGAEVADDFYIFWALAQRMGVPLDYLGVPLDMTRPPTADELFTIVTDGSLAPLEELKKHPRGALFEGEPEHVLPPEPGHAGRFTVMPDDVAAELAEVAAEPATGRADGFLYRMSCRRNRDVFNSMGRNLPSTRKRITHNVAFLNPDDMAAEGVAAGDRVEVTSDAGAIVLVAAADPDLRRGVVSINHGFGGLPDEEGDYLKDGVSTNLLISTERHREAINAMPRMSGIPVALRKVGWPSNL
jgi:anaerobic selenocysteine-containing dehydrogenase